MKVICEIGSNFKTFDDCIQSIDDAKACGADIVKFQYYDNIDLSGVPGDRQCLPELNPLAVHAALTGIEFMCTAFSPAKYQAIDRFVKRHKIASSEITHLDLLETVASLGKPVLLSTGGALPEEVDQALGILAGCPVTLMFCVAEYPARIVDFRHLLDMKDRYGHRYAYGYSDHSSDVLNVPVLARNHGAVIIEKHVNFAGHSDTPDARHSLSREEFQLMVKHLKGQTGILDTFRENPHKRVYRTPAGGAPGYYRPE